ncbi:MAG: phosphoribosylanthranilate isomerase, partial [Planctomycetota bacterium]
MFKIKICGVRQAKDIEAVHAAGADAIGLNFFPPSVRYVDPDASSTLELAKLAQAAGIRVIGLFVNAPAGDVARVCDRLALDAAQFHGDEKLEELCELKRQLQIPLIRAIK